MHKKRRAVLKIFFASLFTVLVLMLLGVAWLRYAPAGQLKESILHAIPYPLAEVGGKFIKTRDFYQRLTVAERVYSGRADFNMANAKEQIFRQLVREQEVSLVAARHGVSVSNREIETGAAEAERQMNAREPNGFQSFLDQNGLTKAEFKNNIMRPQQLWLDLNLWFNRQQMLNDQAYKKVASLQQSLQAGTSFETLANQQSEDTASKQLEGDLGFLDIQELLPEFKEQLDGTSDGEVKLISSRYGLHLVKVAGHDNGGMDGGTRLHIKQIFVKTSDFSKWFEQQRQNYKTHIFVKI